MVRKTRPTLNRNPQTKKLNPAEIVIQPPHAVVQEREMGMIESNPSIWEEIERSER